MNDRARHMMAGIRLLAFAAATSICLSLPAVELPGDPDLRDDSELVNRSDVQKDLELLDEQVHGLKRNLAQFKERHRQWEARMASLPPDERIKGTSQLLSELLEDKRQLRQEILLPHQLSRLVQLRWQYRALNDPIKTFDQTLKLTDEQKAQMRGKESELGDELLKKMRSFHARSQREILDILTPEQRIERPFRTFRS